jgi:hypothetical protein
MLFVCFVTNKSLKTKLQSKFVQQEAAVVLKCTKSALLIVGSKDLADLTWVLVKTVKICRKLKNKWILKKIVPSLITIQSVRFPNTANTSGETMACYPIILITKMEVRILLTMRDRILIIMIRSILKADQTQDLSQELPTL